jgi:hypothetical protein
MSAERIGILNSLFHEFAVYPPFTEGASARTPPPAVFTKFSPLDARDLRPLWR